MIVGFSLPARKQVAQWGQVNWGEQDIGGELQKEDKEVEGGLNMKRAASLHIFCDTSNKISFPLCAHLHLNLGYKTFLCML